jgi:hypothetical protein
MACARQLDQIGAGELADLNELVAFEARDGIGRRSVGRETPRKLDDEAVAGRPAEGLVHALEAVGLDRQHRQRARRRVPRLRDGVRQAVGEQVAVG